MREVGRLLGEVKPRRVRRGNAAKEVGRLQAVPGPLHISTILSRDLHEFLGAIQCQLIAVTLELCVAFLVYPNADHKPAIGRSHARSHRSACHDRSL